MSSKIKILHVIKSLGRGGAEMLLPETLQLHNQEKFEFHYIYFLPWKDQMVDAIEQAEGKVTCFRSKNNIQLLLKVKELRDYCDNHEIDIIHCHLPWAGFAGRLIHKLSGIPVVYSEHNMQERYHPVTKALNKLTFNWQTLALAVSEDVKNSIQKNIAPNLKVRTLLNGVNTDSYQRVHNNEIRTLLAIPEDAFVIGLVAVFRFQKRIDEWLKVFKEFSREGKNVYGIIVGAGPLENEISQKLIDLNLKDKVFLVGLQTNTKPYFEAMDVFMMTSSFEGLPIALLEAMSMECAIVTTNAGGIKEVIRDKIDGKLYDVDELNAMPSALEELYNDSKILLMLKENARKRVVKSFSLKSMVAELEREYLDIYHNAN